VVLHYHQFQQLPQVYIRILFFENTSYSAMLNIAEPVPPRNQYHSIRGTRSPPIPLTLSICKYGPLRMDGEISEKSQESSTAAKPGLSDCQYFLSSNFH
jgi:hypothetical protein